MTKQSTTPPLNQSAAAGDGAPKQQEFQPKETELWIRAIVACDEVDTPLEHIKKLAGVLRNDPHVSHVRAWQSTSYLEENIRGASGSDSGPSLHAGDAVKVNCDTPTSPTVGRNQNITDGYTCLPLTVTVTLGTYNPASTTSECRQVISGMLSCMNPVDIHPDKKGKEGWFWLDHFHVTGEDE